MQHDLRNRTAVVTGGGSGIGRVTALALAQAGARVLIADVAEPGAREVADLIRSGGGEAIWTRTDVSSAPEVAAMVATAVDRLGGVEIAILNAGIGGMDAATADHTEEVWRQVIDVNLTGVWLCMKHVIPHMLRGGSGVIVNVASVAGLVGYPHHVAYAASKHGVIGLTRTAALEYGKGGIRINAICPGFTRTPMVEEGLIAGSADAERFLVSRIPLGRLGTPEEIAASIVYLCSDSAAFMIGQALTLDGGITAG